MRDDALPLRVGVAFTLDCTLVEGTPVGATLTWRVDGNTLPTTDPFLTFDNPTKEDDGTSVECIADNGATDTASRSLDIECELIKVLC